MKVSNSLKIACCKFPRLSSGAVIVVTYFGSIVAAPQANAVPLVAPKDTAGTAYTAKIRQVHFTSDYEVNATQNLITNETSTFGSSGARYKQPEWVPGAPATRNSPMVHKMGETVTVKVTIKVTPAGKNFTLIGDAAVNYLDFSQTTVSTGVDQEITISAAAPLPNEIKNIYRGINWKVVFTDPNPDVEKGAVTSGPHRIFAVYNTPDEAVDYGSNACSWKRLNTLVAEAGGGASIHDIAAAIQAWRDGESADQGGAINHSGTAAGNYWEMLDGTATGQCAQGAILMVKAMRLLGIPAEYHHVFASSSLPVRTTPTNNKQTRNHSAYLHNNATSHNTEELLMVFGGNSSFAGWNGGEGCTSVTDGTTDEYYAAFAGGHIGKTGDVVGPTTATSPAHSILLKLDGGKGTLQQWQMNHVNPDWTETITDPMKYRCPGPNEIQPIP